MLAAEVRGGKNEEVRDEIDRKESTSHQRCTHREPVHTGECLRGAWLHVSARVTSSLATSLTALDGYRNAVECDGGHKDKPLAVHTPVCL